MSGSATLPWESGMGNINFSCRDESISSDHISDPEFWKIAERNIVAATVAGSLVIVFFVVGFCWNMFIMVTFLVKHHLLKEAGNVFLFNVAIIDSLMCLITMTFAYITAFSREFVFGATDKVRCIMCDVSGFFLSFLVLATVHLLSALSVDRFIVLSKPLRYKHIMNHRKAWLICIFIYILCFFLSLLPHVHFGEIEFNTGFGSCVPRFSGASNLYYVMFVAIEMCIPALILAVTNVWTVRLISKFLHKNFLRKSAYPKKEKKEHKKMELSKHQKQQMQLVKVFGAMFIANIFSYTPTIVLAFVAFALSYVDEGRVPPPEVYVFAYVCFLSNPVSHPIIESFFVKDLRYELTRARKGIHHAGTVIYQRTTSLAFSKNLEEAEQKLEEADSSSSNESSKNQKTTLTCQATNPISGCSTSSVNQKLISSCNGSLGIVNDQQSQLMELDRGSVSIQDMVIVANEGHLLTISPSFSKPNVNSRKIVEQASTSFK